MLFMPSTLPKNPLYDAFYSLPAQERKRTITIIGGLFNISDKGVLARLRGERQNNKAEKWWWSIVLNKPIEELFPKN